MNTAIAGAKDSHPDGARHEARGRGGKAAYLAGRQCVATPIRRARHAHLILTMQRIAPPGAARCRWRAAFFGWRHVGMGGNALDIVTCRGRGLAGLSFCARAAGGCPPRLPPLIERAACRTGRTALTGAQIALTHVSR